MTDANMVFVDINIWVMMKGIISIYTVKEITLLKAKDIRKNYKFSFWDSLIIASALENNCNFLFPENMHHNLKKIINPFKEA
ncbi:hypothetical protein [Persephonella sp.]